MNCKTLPTCQVFLVILQFHQKPCLMTLWHCVKEPGLAWPQQVQHMGRTHSPQEKATQQPFKYVLHWGGDGRSSPRHVSPLQ